MAQEWKLTEDKIDHLAKAYLDDALDTIQLYRIPLTQQLCDCFGASYATHARRIVCERGQHSTTGDSAALAQRRGDVPRKRDASETLQGADGHQHPPNRVKAGSTRDNRSSE